MNKREFIAELWTQVETLCIKQQIKCSKCLDMKGLWTADKKKGTHMVVACYKCCKDNTSSRPVTKDADFYGNIGEKQVMLFEYRDDSPGNRIEILKEIEKEREESGLIRMTDLLMKRDNEFADGSAVEKFGKNRIKEFSRTLRYNRLQSECAAFLQDIVESHSFPWKKQHEITVAFTWPELYTHGFSWDIIEDENMYPIYFLIILKAHNYMNWFKIVDSCSVFSDEVYVQVKTYLLYPKNDRALEICHNIVSDYTHNKHLLDSLPEAKYDPI